jgi:hypothetical protein
MRFIRNLLGITRLHRKQKKHKRKLNVTNIISENEVLQQKMAQFDSTP